MKLSNQAVGALLMTLQKCLLEQTDIVPLLENWELKVEDDEVVVINPPNFTVTENESESA
jgi:hypothetical protein|tara:strand:+ start:384 stop:563 length:180 start_codon:yes stop_codon:yes gene_type:complete